MLSARCLLPIRSDLTDEGTPEQDAAPYVVSNNNRWSRIVLNFEGVNADTWCEFTFQLEWDAQEESRSVHDFAVVGVDFLTEDGSSIDFSYVPGLTRSQIDSHSWHVAGPDFLTNGPSSRISCGFFVPSPAKKLAVSIRSWRNSHSFIVRSPKLIQEAPLAQTDNLEVASTGRSNGTDRLRTLSVRRTWRKLNTEPTWLRYALLPGRRLLVRGQIINEGLGIEGALARIVYRDVKGEELPPPYADVTVSPSVGAFIDIPVHRQARRFTLDLVPPPAATDIEIGFQTWNAETRMELVTPLEVSLEDDLLLEAISRDDLPDAPTFFLQLMKELGSPEQLPSSAILKKLLDPKALASPLTYHAKIRLMQRGGRTTTWNEGLSLGSFPNWPLPEALQWTEDPFQSPAWRLEFHSLTWLCDLVREDAPDSLRSAISLAISWSRANPWGNPKDSISAHPRSLAGRAEAFLYLLSLSVRSPKATTSQDTLTLLSELLRHAFALAQLLSQNVFSHSAVQLHAASTLLSIAQSLPAIPLAPYWTSIALSYLQDGFYRMVDDNGVFVEQSLHTQLELISLGLVLIRQMESDPELREFREDLTNRLRKSLRTLVAVTSPSGSLPPFGDAPHGFHHASWLRRLLSECGAGFLKDYDLAAELSYPTGRKVFASSEAGIITARRYDRNARWSYFCASLNGRQHEHGHFDCTSFIYSAGGAPWIIDPRGSNLHETGAARQFLTASRAHNVALPDGREQIAGTSWIEHQEELEGAIVFCLGSNAHGPEYMHKRIFIGLDDLHAMVVLDQFATQSRPVSFEGFLHFDPGIVAAIANSQMAAAYRKNERLRIIPHALQGQFSGMSIENGRNDRPATIQGYVARSTGGLQPANVLSYRFSGSGTVCGGVMLATSDKAAHTLSRIMKTEAVRSLLNRSIHEKTYS
jgi:hypothetical protein